MARADLSQDFAQQIVRATLTTEAAWVRKCPGDGTCTHDDDRWFWTQDHKELKCHGRGEARLTRLILRLHLIMGWLRLPDGCVYEPDDDDTRLAAKDAASLAIQQSVHEQFIQDEDPAPAPQEAAPAEAAS